MEGVYNFEFLISNFESIFNDLISKPRVSKLENSNFIQNSKFIIQNFRVLCMRPKERPMVYQLVGKVMAYQGYDG